MSHTHPNESCPSKWVMSQQMSHVPHTTRTVSNSERFELSIEVRMSHVTHTCVWVMSHTCVYKSCHTSLRAMSQIWKNVLSYVYIYIYMYIHIYAVRRHELSIEVNIRHVTHTSTWVMSHILTSHVPNIKECAFIRTYIYIYIYTYICHNTFVIWGGYG